MKPEELRKYSNTLRESYEDLSLPQVREAFYLASGGEPSLLKWKEDTLFDLATAITFLSQNAIASYQALVFSPLHAKFNLNIQVLITILNAYLSANTNILKRLSEEIEKVKKETLEESSNKYPNITVSMARYALRASGEPHGNASYMSAIVETGKDNELFQKSLVMLEKACSDLTKMEQEMIQKACKPIVEGLVAYLKIVENK